MVAGLARCWATVEAIEADPSANRDFGIALTHAEFDTLYQMQKRLLDKMLAVQEAAAADPGFAGLWIEKSEGFALHVATTSETAAERSLVLLR